MKFLWPTMLLWLFAVPALVAAYVWSLSQPASGGGNAAPASD